LQGDGNLVLYDTASVAYWASNTDGQGVGPYKLVLQDSGVANIVDGTGAAIWDSNAAVAPAGGGSSGGAVGGNTLAQGAALAPGAQLTSANGAYGLVYQVRIRVQYSTVQYTAVQGGLLAVQAASNHIIYIGSSLDTNSNGSSSSSSTLFRRHNGSGGSSANLVNQAAGCTDEQCQQQPQ
jgi:hypothetical protein